MIKLAARAGALDLVEEFGVDAERDEALDDCTRLAIGAGFDALRDAGIPLVLHYKTTTIGSQLPERWGLPDALRDDTGIIFASAFPGLGEFASDIERSVADRSRRGELAALGAMRSRIADPEAAAEVDRRIAEVQAAADEEPFEFDRRFLFRILAMGHSQFAEIIGARGPNTQINSACASTTQAIALAEDWIRAGRCRRVVIVAADNVTSDALLDWIGAGFLATGAAATDAVVEEAAVPFDNRRHGMLLGMGAAAIVVESAEAARERGIQPICEVLAAVTANSAFHGTKLDVDHISAVMEHVVAQAEARGIDRHAIAPETVFVSHETYTPARGGSAQAEISALRSVFGADADKLVIANTKGFTGHPMGVGIEDVVAVKALETGIVPPVPNFKEVDAALGELNLSIGGAYPVRYALRLAAGFGSQIAMTLLRWTPVADGRHRAPGELGYQYRIVDPVAWRRWLADVTGRDDARLEIVQRRLRVVDTGAPVPTETPATTPSDAKPVPETNVVREREPDAAPSSEAPAATIAASEPMAAPVAVPVAVPEVAVADAVLAIVAAKTGYPVDMLDFDLDLEADLGIDTVKQAEMFAAIRERYGIERDDKLKLRDYPTLAHVIAFVHERAPATGAAAPTASEAPAATIAASEPMAAPVAVPVAVPEVAVADAVLALVAAKTGYPVDMLDFDLDLEADLGIDTVKQAEMFAAIRERYGIERDDKLKLRDYPTLAHVIAFVNERAPATGAAAPTASEAPAATIAASEPMAAPVAVPVRCRRWRWRTRCWRWSPRRPATRSTCSTSTSISRPISASTRSSRPRCSRPSASGTASNATTSSSCATTRRSPTSSRSSTSAPRQPARPPRRRPSPLPARPSCPTDPRSLTLRTRTGSRGACRSRPPTSARGLRTNRCRVARRHASRGRLRPRRGGCRPRRAAQRARRRGPLDRGGTRRRRAHRRPRRLARLRSDPRRLLVQALDDEGAIENWTSPAGGSPIGSGSSCSTPPCAGCTTRSGSREHSSWPAPGSAAATATTPRARSRPSVVPSPVSPRRSPWRSPARW